MEMGKTYAWNETLWHLSVIGNSTLHFSNCNIRFFALDSDFVNEKTEEWSWKNWINFLITDMNVRNTLSYWSLNEMQ